LGAMEHKEGFVDVLGCKLFYESFGKAKKGNILCLHGGPGMTHDYMLSMADLAEDGYRVTFYDQQGCGKSEVPKDKRLFVPERFVEEVEVFRKRMKLGRPHIKGSSWGGMLAIAYALKYQRNMRSMVTVGGLHSVPLTVQEMDRMKRELPKDVQSQMAKYEEAGDYENPAYVAAAMVFYRKHVCRLDPWPKEVTYSLDHVSKPVYYTMNGPNEFTIIGNTRYWDVTDRLRTIRVPTLVLTGKYDEVSPRVGREIRKHIPNSKLVVFPRSSHTPFWEERESFMRTVLGFLGKNQ
jgi:proline iminopeptidase